MAKLRRKKFFELLGKIFESFNVNTLKCNDEELKFESPSRNTCQQILHHGRVLKNNCSLSNFKKLKKKMATSTSLLAGLLPPTHRSNWNICRDDRRCEKRVVDYTETFSVIIFSSPIEKTAKIGLGKPKVLIKM